MAVNWSGPPIVRGLEASSGADGSDVARFLVPDFATDNAKHVPWEIFMELQTLVWNTDGAVFLLLQDKSVEVRAAV